MSFSLADWLNGGPVNNPQGILANQLAFNPGVNRSPQVAQRPVQMQQRQNVPGFESPQVLPEGWNQGLANRGRFRTMSQRPVQAARGAFGRNEGF
jgi:hypothetical protein